MPQTYNVGSRSMFVTFTAWIFILGSAAGFVLALIENAAAASLLPGFSIVGDPHPSGLTGLVVSYMPWVAGTGSLVSIATLAAAIGLLLRYEWARRVFIGLVAFELAMSLAGIWMQQEVLASLADATLGHVAIPAAAAGVVGGFVTAARVLAVLVSFAACGGMAWILGRLMSPAIRQEFA